MTKKYYKVVTKDMESVIMNPKTSYESWRNDFCIKYVIGEWIKPKMEGTSIMVFDDLRAAKKFRSAEFNARKIFECEVKNPRRQGFITNLSDVQRVYNKLKSLIRRKKKRTDLYRIYKKDWIPASTVFCSAVKLVKEVV
ncbi:MAG: hypothetical protein KDD03_13200 [Gelidibacter sp.]|nr:hypothetical protein [Gelidibacter sp.]